MANQELLKQLKQNVDTWNIWRKQHLEVQLDLKDADLSMLNLSWFNLSDADLSGANLIGANLIGANLSGANLTRANLTRAHLRRAKLIDAYLIDADLRDADLRDANLNGVCLDEARLNGATFINASLRFGSLNGANLTGANLTRSNLTGANLNGVTLVGTNLTYTTLTDCSIYGISAWDIQLDGAQQFNLIITPENSPAITVDNLEIAQFIYLLLNNSNIRHVIDTITSKVVLILGCFTPDRKAVLDRLRDTLRSYGYLPILFDFVKPANRDITETISTLAHLARFVIADITDAKSISQELMLIVPSLPSVPVQPLILHSQHEYGMFEHFIRYPWVLPIYRYKDEESLLNSLKESIIDPAEEKAKRLERP